MISANNGNQSPQSESYDDAASALMSPIHQATTPATIRAAAARRTNTLNDMNVYLMRLGLDLNGSGVGGVPLVASVETPSTSPSADAASDTSPSAKYNPQLIFHVTGTKGKGSTLSLTESILRNSYNLNTGMFTSPHLVCIRERIRINGVPISKQMFGRVYWRVRRRLEEFDGEANNTVENGDDGLSPLPTLPGYFRMLTLMALYTFCYCRQPKIDAILLEVGMGGRYDATNVFEPMILQSASSNTVLRRILVRGVTLIDYDHTRVLGSTLEQIAWEKGGIFVVDKLKRIGRGDGGYDSFLKSYNEKKEEESGSEVKDLATVFVNGNNTPRVLGVLQHIATEEGNNLQIANDSELDAYHNIGLQGEHQRSNAALALAMCRHAMKECSAQSSTEVPLMQQTGVVGAALSKTFWPGRCHTVSLPTHTDEKSGVEQAMNLRCDGAHTPVSMKACIDWFRSVANNGESGSDIIHKVLLFNCSHERNPLPLLYSLYQSKMFESVFFCRSDFERPSALPKKLEEEWTQESLNSSEGAPVTLEDMCNKLAAANCDISLSPLKLSASTWQRTLANVWKVFSLYNRHIEGDCAGKCFSSSETVPCVKFGLCVTDAIPMIREESLARLNGDEGNSVRVEVCVTGSLYIVGSALEAAGWEEGESAGVIN